MAAGPLGCGPTYLRGVAFAVEPPPWLAVEAADTDVEAGAGGFIRRA